MSYTQLTREQRYQIYALLKAGHKQTQIAAIVTCHKSTISRELRRNRGHKGYRPLQAQQLSSGRRYKSHPQRIGAQTWLQVELLLLQQWSPEQIAGRLKLEHKATVSHEWIYRYVYSDKKRGGYLYRQLRSQKKQRKRYAGTARRAQIPNRVSIDRRPPIVASKTRLGDWEADTIIGARHKGAILSCTERKSKLTLLRKLESKGALEVKRKCIDLLAPWAAQVHTITVDNGKEFSDHKDIAAVLQTEIYFAHPYASWERGLNENTNGLIRQYFPKKSDFAKISNDEVRCVAARLNNRPRKTLGFKTPNEVFFQTTLVALPN
jgi:IS30 family transposase